MADQLRDFLVKVGFVTCLVVVSFWCLNLIFAPEILLCVSDAGWLGSATKYSDQIEVESRSPEGELVHTTTIGVSNAMQCASLFGKGWHNAHR